MRGSGSERDRGKRERGERGWGREYWKEGQCICEREAVLVRIGEVKKSVFCSDNIFRLQCALTRKR